MHGGLLLQVNEQVNLYLLLYIQYRTWIKHKAEKMYNGGVQEPELIILPVTSVLWSSHFKIRSTEGYGNGVFLQVPITSDEHVKGVLW